MTEYNKQLSGCKDGRGSGPFSHVQTIGLTSGELSVLERTPQYFIGIKGCTWDTVFWSSSVVGTDTNLFGSKYEQANIDWAAAKFKDQTSLSALVAWSTEGASGSWVQVQFIASDPNEKTIRFPSEAVPNYAVGAPHGVALSGPNLTAISAKTLNLAVWSKFDPLESNSSNVLGQFIDSDATLFGATFAVARTSPGYQGEPAVAALENGQFAAAWSGFSSIDETRTDRDIYLRIVKPADLNANPEILVNTKLTGDQTMPKIASFGPDRFIVLWNTGNATQVADASAESFVAVNSGNDIAGRIFNNAGTALTAEFNITTDALDNTDVSVVALDGSTFAAAWSNVTYDGTGKPVDVELNVELFDATGAPLTGHQLPISSIGAMTSPASIDVLSDWRFVVSWAEGKDIMTTVYDTRTTGKTIKGTGGDNNLMGTDEPDRMYGYAGNDWLVGKGGNDLLIGGPGADQVQGDLGNDTASYADAKAGVVASLYTGVGSEGDAAGDVLIAIENLTGSKFADTLTGYYDPNILKGGAGNDKLYGLDGDDQLYVGIGTDLADGGPGTDLVSYLGVGRGVTVDLQTPSANKGEALGDSYVSIEDVGGTGYADVLYGSTVRNRLVGYGGADKLDGRGGSDFLVGGPGKDVLTGGVGGDYFRQFSPGEGPDTVVDFSLAEGDKVSIDAAGFGGTLAAGALPVSALVKGSNPVPPSTASVFLYDTDTGQIFFDVDGTGSQPKVELMTLVGVPAIDVGDFQVF
ncbi:calcium-binding protein [Oharaeibacter diazotrophicus]|uniref:Hemolysin type calcium-binding protein n=1 Tax=Oharaeibacter diazotrophicus TaxID=1920512 RepID=A0A4R6RJ57_9HYPH|nr:calcium-binding protein [Oharaeibacter diazotrophicus]TDP86434.1 hypothetical protein EDD54_0308 [Oharaeibacter diazotrophicus]BBE71624.1 bifunctional hemolysin/adenylate cyclase precursor [Pleomorphomonas sp. SM30]GLS78386.1 hypothetical protein GCM10007904_37230 [Oharaeibacter diazotrophicus]